MLVDVVFPSATPGVALRGWLRTPEETAGPLPAIVLVGGFGDSAERSAPAAEALAARGYAVLYYDHRNTGISDGQPRLEIDGPSQVRDLRMAVTYAQTRDEIDSARVAVFGTSFGGSLAIAVGATDNRVAAVAATVPWISGFEVAMHGGGVGAIAGFQYLAQQDMAAVAAGAEPSLVALGKRASDPDQSFSLFRDDAAMDYFEHGPAGLPASWRNEMTISSLMLALDHDVTALAGRISPRPFLMIVAAEDATMPLDTALEFYNRALEPKRLEILPGGHYDTYLPDRTLPQVIDAVDTWFADHLKK